MWVCGRSVVQKLLQNSDYLVQLRLYRILADVWSIIIVVLEYKFCQLRIVLIGYTYIHPSWNIDDRQVYVSVSAFKQLSLCQTGQIELYC